MRYEIQSMPRITAGAGAAELVGGLTAGRTGATAGVLLVADPGLRPSGAIRRVAASLRKARLGVETFLEFGGDPTFAQVDAAVGLARARRVRAVVSLGGGSALDLGKAVAAIAGSGKPAADFDLAANPLPARRIVSVVVPTTSGTGSEATRVSVLTRGDGAKSWLWGDALKADEIVLDPELTYSLPPAMTATTGMDALVHAIEAATTTRASAANNLYAHEAIRLVVAHLERAVGDGADAEARAAMQRAALLAGQAIDNAGTGMGHNIGHALASLGKIHHGRAVAIGMVATLAFNVARDNGAYAAVARAMGVRGAKAVPQAFADLAGRVGVALSIRREFRGIGADRLAAEMAKPQNDPMRKANHRTVSDADLAAFAKAVLTI